MSNEKDPLAYESVLPENFDGVFKFSNPSDEDFIGEWNKKEYLFPARSTVPMIMVEHTPLEIQHIRKHFAKKLAEREFFKGAKYEQFRLREGVKDEMGMIQPRGYGMSHAGMYNLNDLAPYIQQCLEPLEEKVLTGKSSIKPTVTDKLSRNDDGELNTQVVDEKTSLRDKALTGN